MTTTHPLNVEQNTTDVFAYEVLYHRHMKDRKNALDLAVIYINQHFRNMRLIQDAKGISKKESQRLWSIAQTQRAESIKYIQLAAQLERAASKILTEYPNIATGDAE